MRSVYFWVLALVFSSSALMAQDKIGSLNANQLNEIIPTIVSVDVLFFNEPITLNIPGEDAQSAVLYYELGDVTDFDDTQHKPLCEMLYSDKAGLVLECKVYYSDKLAVLVSKYKGVKYINYMSSYGKQFYAGIMQQLKQRKGN